MYIKNFSILKKGREYHDRKSGTTRVAMETKPSRTWDPLKTYNYIRSDKLKEVTEQARAMVGVTDKAEQQLYKQKSFPCAMFSGVFEYRKANCLIAYNGLICLDIDDIEPDSIPALSKGLIESPHLDVVLLFRSPRGHGIKVVVDTHDSNPDNHRDNFWTLFRLIRFEFGISIDVSGSDVSRLCYLCHDPECYINPKFLK